MIKFEYDERKSQSNLEKHGIDFVDAQALWNDPYLMIMPLAPLNSQKLNKFKGSKVCKSL